MQRKEQIQWETRPWFSFWENGLRKKKIGRIIDTLPIIFFEKMGSQKKIMGSAHFLAVQFFGAQDSYIPISSPLIQREMSFVCSVFWWTGNS